MGTGVLGMWRIAAGAAAVAVATLSGCNRKPATVPPDAWLQDKSARNGMPEFRVIASAKTADLTPASQQPDSYLGWYRSQGDERNTRYSALSQVNRDNVARLRVAWTYHSRDGANNVQANPLIVAGVLYGPTAGRAMVAIDAATGREIWRFKLPFDMSQSIGGPAHHGLAYDPGDDRRPARILFSANGYLFALNAKTGRPDLHFGDDGHVSSSKGPGRSAFLASVAPVIWRNVIVAANQNLVDAYDLATGRRLWHFNTITYAVRDPQDDNGGNVWGGMALDTARGLVFVAAGDPHPNFVGIGRPGSNKFTNSVIALDVRSGRVRWFFQNIAHDLWDLDLSAAPNLVTVTHEGKRVDAVAQVTKQGNTLLLDRLSGRPLFPFRMRRAPTSSLPGEHTAPYQPAPELPQPFARQEIAIGDATNLTPQAQAASRQAFQKARYGWFVPAGLDAPIILYGIHGGAEWSGASFDPTTGILYVTANEVALSIRLTKATDTNASPDSSVGSKLFESHCAACHGRNRQGQGMAPSLVAVGQRLSSEQIADVLKQGRGAMPSFSGQLSNKDRMKIVDFLSGGQRAKAPSEYSRDRSRQAPEDLYSFDGFNRFLDASAYPATKPPWGTLNALDLNSGKLLWKVPLGEYPELTRRGIPKTGTENFGGAMVTGGGLVFAAGTRDNMIRAFDKATGKELWKYKLPWGGFAPPATYEVNGKQYVVIAATGGGKLGSEAGDAYVAFSLP